MAKGRLLWRKRPDLYLGTLEVLRAAAGRGWCVLWLTFTSVPGFEARKLLPAHRDLLRRLESQRAIRPHYIGFRTFEGHGVLHVFWLFSKPNVFIPKEWLWNEWGKLTGARSVHINRCGATSEDTLKLARYAAGQPLFVRSFKSVGLKEALYGS